MIRGPVISIFISVFFTISVFIPFLYIIFTQAELSIEIILSSIIALAILILHILFLFQSVMHQRQAYTMTYGLLLGIIASMVAGFGELSINIPFLPSGSTTNLSLIVQAALFWR